MDGALAPTSDPSEVEARLALPLAEAMLTQRAVRRVQPDPVDDRIVLRCLELALEAPSASNGQSWEFVVVKDRAVKASLAAQYRRVWRLYGGLGRLVKTDEHISPETKAKTRRTAMVSSYIGLTRFLRIPSTPPPDQIASLAPIGSIWT